MTTAAGYREVAWVAGVAAVLLGCAGPRAATVPERPARVTASPVAVRAIAKPAPELFVVVESVADRSERTASTALRRERATDMRQRMLADLQASPAITLAAEQARALGIPQFSVDATIERLEQRVRGGTVEIACQLRVAVTDQRGKMLFLLTNGAAVRVPLVGFRAEFEPPLQRDALEGAVRELNADLVARLEAEVRAQASAEVALAAHP